MKTLNVKLKLVTLDIRKQFVPEILLGNDQRQSASAQRNAS
jgi:hypothetical protein